MFARISFPISSFKTFTYKVPNSLSGKLALGSCVNAPIKNRQQIGYVIEFQNQTNYKGKILSIHSIRDEKFQLPSELWETMEWISHYYMTPIGQVLKTALPKTFSSSYSPKLIKYVKISSKLPSDKDCSLNSKPAQKRIYNVLKDLNEPIRISSLKLYASSPKNICETLSKDGLVDIISQPQISDPFDIMGIGKQKIINLSKDQQSIVDKITSNKSEFYRYLLHGVTGSGKTEVYLKLAQYIVNRGKSVLVLVPEISLTPQVASKFRNAFGKCVALWHSKMTKAEKAWTWEQLKLGEYKVVVGARSAIFSPLANLGLIIVDEEQEGSYKQENPAPRYNARDVAILRANKAQGIVLLTSATPSLESYYNALKNKFKLLQLTKRFGQSVYPDVKLVDMKKEKFVDGKNIIISDAMINAIKDRLKKSEQIIILHNRRGYSRIHQCLDCGEIRMCHKCLVAMTYHKTDNKLHCHYCDYCENVSKSCYACKSENLVFSGVGTQKVENILLNHFPDVNILRMDMDTVRKKNSYNIILNKFANREADILLGTQMIAKGLDFDNVTLVGVVNADSGLFFPDFRAGEKVFQLIYQVAGRAGRRQKKGLAIIQTYSPDDINIKMASILNIHKFYNISLAQRQELNYPPFSRLCRIIFSGLNKNHVQKFAIQIGNILKNEENYHILGPSVAPIEKLKGEWRYHIIIKSNNKKVANISRFIIKKIGYSIFERKFHGVKSKVDIDPISML